MEEKAPIRVLHYGLSDNYGGVEAYVMDIYRHIDKTQVQFDFLVAPGVVLPTEEEILQLGGRIFKEDTTPILKKHPILARKRLMTFFQQHQGEFQGIHCHYNMMFDETKLVAAKKVGIPKRVFHAHNNSVPSHRNNVIFSMYSKLIRHRVKKNATDFFAASHDAGIFQFGKNIPFVVKKNGIDEKRFGYHPEVREEIRKKLGYEKDDFVFGFVGRFAEQKNPLKVLGVFDSFLKENSHGKLWMSGSGVLENDVKEKINQLGISDQVTLDHVTSGIENYYQGMDVFLLPSLYEGLGIVAIEAQCAGLPTFVADTLPKETKISPFIHYLSITESDENWRRKIAHDIKNSKRQSGSSFVKEAGFSINDTTQDLLEFYLTK